jgi:multiple sugar transport system ATP-binding protein
MAARGEGPLSHLALATAEIASGPRSRYLDVAVIQLSHRRHVGVIALAHVPTHRWRKWQMADVRIQHVEKSFASTRILNGVSLDVAAGEFVSLVGPSGCGKTTLMRIVAGLEAVSTGSINIDGRNVTGVRAADRDVAMVFQNYALYPHLTVAQNLAVPLAMRRLSAMQRLPVVGGLFGQARATRAGIAADVLATAEMLEIDHLMPRKPAQLSGGQRQRVALGRAIVRQPKLFLMDEPLSNLDAALRVQMRTEIVALHRRVGASTIYVTHDQSEAMTMSDRVAIMMDGNILQVGSPEEIYTDPQDIRVASFIGSPRINMLASEVGADMMARIGGVASGLAAPVPGPATFAVRPEDLGIADNGFACIIEQIEFLGDSALLHARHVSGGEVLIARIAGSNRPRLPVGSAIRLLPDPARSLLFDAAGKRIPSWTATRTKVHG